MIEEIKKHHELFKRVNDPVQTHESLKQLSFDLLKENERLLSMVISQKQTIDELIRLSGE